MITKFAVWGVVSSALLLACSSTPARTGSTAASAPLQPSKPTGQPISVVTAKSPASIALGIDAWEIYITSTGVTTYGVTSAGKVLTEQRTRAQKNAQGVLYQESRAFYPYPAVAVTDANGTILKNTFLHSKTAAYALAGAAQDIAAQGVAFDNCAPTAAAAIAACGQLAISEGKTAAGLNGLGCWAAVQNLGNDCQTEIQAVVDAVTSTPPIVDCTQGPPDSSDPSYNEYCYNCGCPASSDQSVAPGDSLIASSAGTSDPGSGTTDPGAGTTDPGDPGTGDPGSAADSTDPSSGSLGDGDCCDDSGNFCGCDTNG